MKRSTYRYNRFLLPILLLMHFMLLQCGYTGDTNVDERSQESLRIANDITVDWEHVVGKINSSYWGVNDFAIVKQSSPDENTLSFLKEIKPGIVRIHRAGLVNEWTSTQTRDWNKELIKQQLSYNYDGYQGAKIILTLSEWPDFISTKKILPQESYIELAELFARLPIYMNELGFKIEYYEFLNEKETVYDQLGIFDQYCELLKELAISLKESVHNLKLDYEVKVGGPAFSYAKMEWYQAYIDKMYEVIDFVSWHSYAVGPSTIEESTSERNKKIFDKIFANVETVNSIKKYISKYEKCELELFLDEYNIQWTWDPYESRHHNNFGAVWIACQLKELAKTDLSGAAIWNLRDQAYGLTKDGLNISAPGILFRWASKFLIGEMVQANSSLSDLDILAIKGIEDNYSILLINKSSEICIVEKFKELIESNSNGELKGWRLDASCRRGDDWIPKVLEMSEDSVGMNPWSLILLTNNIKI